MKDLKNITRILKALSDKGRLRIVMLLCERQSLCVCEIKEVIGLSQPTISSHLKLLEASGLLESKKEGLWVNYRLAEDMEEEIKLLVSSLYQWLKEDKRIKEDIVKSKDVASYNRRG